MLSCEGQARLGHEVHLAFGPIYGPEGSMLERVRAFSARADRPIRTWEVADLVREINPLRDRRALGQLKRLIREIEPDIVHTHSSKAGILGRSAAWSVLRRVRGASERRFGVVHTIHGPPFHTRLPAHVNVLYALAERYAAGRCHMIVAVADAMREQFLARGIGRAEQYVTVRSGVEVEPYLTAREGESRERVRADLGLGAEDFVIGTVSRLAELKGHDDILDALGEELLHRPAWRLLWVGDGWWRDRLLSRVREMGLEGRVLTTGLVPPERMPGLFRAMDMLVHASYREGLPRAVVQAMLAGVAVVASDADGTREVCIPDRTGVLVGVGDANGLRRGVVSLAEDPALRARLALNARERCVRDFSAQTMVHALEGVYARAIERARG